VPRHPVESLLTGLGQRGVDVVARVEEQRLRREGVAETKRLDVRGHVVSGLGDVGGERAGLSRRGREVLAQPAPDRVVQPLRVARTRRQHVEDQQMHPLVPRRDRLVDELAQPLLAGLVARRDELDHRDDRVVADTPDLT